MCQEGFRSSKAALGKALDQIVHWDSRTSENLQGNKEAYMHHRHCQRKIKAASFFGGIHLYYCSGSHLMCSKQYPQSVM